MARNQEKAQSMLYRFREAMLIEAGIKRNPNDKLSLLPATCTSLPIAEQARRDLLKEISRKLSRIQDSALDEYQIRILNDELNKMVKEKFEWDQKIRELGGIERKSVQFLDKLGAEAPNVHGYLYFGRAKDLPGVKELLHPHREEQIKASKRRQEMYSHVDAAYFGYNPPKGLEQLERQAEQQMAQESGPIIDWATGTASMMPPDTAVLTAEQEKECSEAFDAKLYPVPAQSTVEQHLLELRKKLLLERYVEG